MAESVGSWLAHNGMPAGERIAILADNHPRWVAAYLGIIAAGGAAVPLDTGYHEDQVAKLLKDSGASLLVCDAKHLEIAQEAVSGTEIGIVLTESEGRAWRAAPTQSVPLAASQPLTDFDHICSQQPKGFTPVPRQPDDLASLLYTSGTTAD